MKTYNVHWERELNAHSPQAAAEKALEIIRDPESLTAVFKVQEKGSTDVITVDLLNQDNETV